VSALAKGGSALWPPTFKFGRKRKLSDYQRAEAIIHDALSSIKA
jgi:hypothetical protein